MEQNITAKKKIFFFFSFPKKRLNNNKIPGSKFIRNEITFESDNNFFLPVWAVLHQPGEVGQVGAEAHGALVTVQSERHVSELGQVSVLASRAAAAAAVCSV